MANSIEFVDAPPPGRESAGYPHQIAVLCHQRPRPALPRLVGLVRLRFRVHHYDLVGHPSITSAHIESSRNLGLDRDLRLVYAGYWYATGLYSTKQQLWEAIWTIIGSMGIVAVVLVLNAHEMTEGLAITPQLLAEESLLGAAGGGFASLLIGIGAT